MDNVLLIMKILNTMLSLFTETFSGPVRMRISPLRLEYIAIYMQFAFEHVFTESSESKSLEIILIARFNSPKRTE